MARGGRSSPGAVVLPKVQFERIKDDVSTQPNGVHDGQARSFGYNDFSDFRRPDYYIRHIEPLEIDLARQVEYDMDEQDQEWLELVNAERKKEQIDKVSFEMFEIIMDRLEKEWFDLTKNLPKPDLAMPSEDSTCAVCDDSEGENSNAIVFCDGCNLAVHQDCYGVPYIPEGQWLCRKCTVSPENPVQCFLCPNEGGAFKQTIHGEWVHLLCAIWVPETRVANEVFMEPITGVEKISKQRWKLKCSICEIREGACIQCAKASCFVAFHATCARQEKLLLPMKTTQGAEPLTLQAYCERHLPQEQQETRAAALAAEAKQDDRLGQKQSSKSARAYNKTYKPGPPIVPAIIVNRIIQYINKIKIRKRTEFVQLVCRYWSLKREARRGAPLLKRLHLEPWTASGGKIQTDEEKRMKLDQLQRLRQDLINARMLTQLTRLREMRKLRQAEIIHQILSTALFPHEAALRMALEHIMSVDRNDYFKNPVNKNEVPDYFDVVLNPMCWSMIEDRLDKHEYWDVKTFKDDIDLVIDNALLYNKPGTPFYKTALRIRTTSKPILANLESLATHHALPLPASPNPSPSPDSLPLLGDLEPPLDILDVLASPDAVKARLNLELTSDPLESLFSYEFARYKPALPPSPMLEPKRKKKQKRDRRAEHDKARAKKGTTGTPAAEEDGEGDHDHPEMKIEAIEPRVADYRLPRTRAGLAAVAAFEAEANGHVSASSLSAEGGEVQPSGQKSKKRSSFSSPLPGTPQVVDDVDNRGSFQLFNAGWILPADHRRGGRAPPPVDKPVLPPPRKRQKTDHAASRLSIVSTAASDNQTLRSPSPEGVQPKKEAKMDVDIFSSPSGPSSQPYPPGTPFEGDIISRTSTDASGRIVIEELDTPYTRRQKLLRRKAEKERQRMHEEEFASGAPQDEQEAEVASAPRASSSRPSQAGPSTLAPAKQLHRQEKESSAYAESELSELSDLPTEDANPPEDPNETESDSNAGPASAQTKAKPSKKGKGKGKGKGPSRRLTRMDNYDSGTLVWAKAESYPWWPAVVFDPDHGDIPPNIVRDYQEVRHRRKIKLYIVRFYDRTNSWQYLPRDKLQLLGEDSKLDSDMLAPQSLHQKWKSGTARQSCRDAFRKACAEMETKSDGESMDQVP